MQIHKSGTGRIEAEFRSRLRARLMARPVLAEVAETVDVRLDGLPGTPAPGRAGWVVLWSDGRNLADEAGLLAASLHPQALGELWLVEARMAGPVLLRRAAFRLQPGCLAANRNLAADRAARLVVAGLTDRRTGETRPTPCRLPDPAPLAPLPPAKAAAALARRRVLDLARRAPFKTTWRVGIIDRPIQDSLGWSECPPMRWLEPDSRSRYFADPFGWPGNPDVIFCEEYGYGDGVGRMVRLWLEGAEICDERRIDFGLPGHLSFPFLFEHDGFVHCMPESSAARRLTIFRWNEERRRWRPLVTPLVSIAAADTALFEHDGLLWLAYTDVEIGESDNLNLWFAPRLTGPWQPHANNPVKLDPRNSRSAGTPFRKDGRLYRPTMDCSVRNRHALRLTRIDACTPTTFREEEVACIAPTADSGLAGYHTLSAHGARTLIDAERQVIDPLELGRKLWRRLVRRLGRQ